MVMNCCRETVFGVVQQHRWPAAGTRVIGSAIRLLRERQAYNQPTLCREYVSSRAAR